MRRRGAAGRRRQKRRSNYTQSGWRGFAAKPSSGHETLELFETRPWPTISALAFTYSSNSQPNPIILPTPKITDNRSIMSSAYATTIRKRSPDTEDYLPDDGFVVNDSGRQRKKAKRTAPAAPSTRTTRSTDPKPKAAPVTRKPKTDKKKNDSPTKQRRVAAGAGAGARDGRADGALVDANGDVYWAVSSCWSRGLSYSNSCDGATLTDYGCGARTDFARAARDAQQVPGPPDDQRPGILREGWGDVAGEEGGCFSYLHCSACDGVGRRLMAGVTGYRNADGSVCDVRPLVAGY